ncbi:cytochrome c oxidase assembly protein COX16 homolog, mitochondrial isoform X2 [Patagioenas fasciata]|uniref:cytochrome c oxidase assembly protein COX16 homolog, mitochondrial isoform X2 n=1 Tax=Patagioenas fasciata TaxID=372321 RepID=UPI003A9A44B1
MERLRKLWRGRTMTFGVPLLLYLVGGSFGLREFAQIRYDVHKLHGKTSELGRRVHIVHRGLSWKPCCPLKKKRMRSGREKKANMVDPALKEKLKQNTVTLESEYEKLKGADLDNWENIRGPRLWEDSRTVQQQRREAARLKRE